MNTDQTHPTNVPSVLVKQNTEANRSSYDLITPAWQVAYGFQSQPDGFIYLRDNRLVFLTAKETVFDIELKQIQSASFRLTGSMGLKIAGKKYRVMFMSVHETSRESLLALAKNIFPINSANRTGSDVIEDLSKILEINDAEELSELWKTEFKKYPPIRIHDGGGQKVSGGLFVFIVFGLAPILAFLSTLIVYFYGTDGVSSFVLTGPFTVLILGTIGLVWRSVKKRKSSS
jgi:hypothetical protein